MSRLLPPPDAAAANDLPALRTMRAVAAAAAGAALLAVLALTLLLWLGFAGGALAASASEPTTPAADPGRSLAPYFVVDGAAPGIDALPLKHTRAEVTISGVIAEVRITQVYRNEGAQPLHARYVFPASTRAAVHALRMRIGGRVVDAEIREKRQAQAEFAQARREGKRAALLEQQRPNVFTMAIANVMPGDELAVELQYTETVVPDDGVYRYVFPTVVGPRYVGTEEGRGGADAPAGAAGAGRAEAVAEAAAPAWTHQPFLRAGRPAARRFEFSARVVSPLPIAAASSPTHPLRIDGVGSRELRIALPAAAEHADRDLVLDYRLAGGTIGAGLLVQRGQGPDDENFFLLMAQPPARVGDDQVLPRDYVFVLDVSGSMHGFPLATAKRLLRDLIGRLRPGDTFNVIPFAGGSSQLAARSLPASEANIAAALRFIDGQTGGGGTELLPALRRALALPTEPGRARSFIVVTDGYVTVEKEAFELVRARAGEANLFALGIGTAVNRHLIEGLARAGRGEPLFVLGEAQADAQAARLRRMIEQPLLTRVRVTFPEAGAGVFSAYDFDAPQLPDLFAQRPLLLLGKFRGPLKGTIEIEGLGAAGPLRLPVDVAQAAQAGTAAMGTPGVPGAGGLRQLWARSRIAELGDLRLLAPDDAGAREITALGLRYRLLTEFTSFVAVDKVVVNAGGAGGDVDAPSPLPAGVGELAVAAAPATPEPPFALLAACAGAALWWARRRSPGRGAGGASR